MSDEAGIRPTTPAGPVTHRCEVAGCTKRGEFGFAPAKNSVQRWWCWEHYPYKAPGKPTTNGPLPSQV